MAGWGDNWGFDWGNAVEDAQLTAFPIQVTASVKVPTVTSPSALVALSRIAVAANVRVPNVAAQNVTPFNPDHPFAIRKEIGFTQTISRTIAAGVGS